MYMENNTTECFIIKAARLAAQDIKECDLKTCIKPTKYTDSALTYLKKLDMQWQVLKEVNNIQKEANKLKKNLLAQHYTQPYE